MARTKLARARRGLAWLLAERGRLVGFGARSLAARLPRLSRLMIGRRLRRRADLARDGLDHELAAALYEEVLHFLPGDQRTHLQTGHMYKEAGRHDLAEAHYREADRTGPRTGEIALQLGHFYKVAGRMSEAESAYREALALRPGWAAALQELARLGSITADMPAGDGSTDNLIVELLPTGMRSRTVPRGTLQVRRLGGTRKRSQDSMLKTLCGVEAIRGYCITDEDANAVQILVDGISVHVEPVWPHAIPGLDSEFHKYPFNAWCDFSALPSGRVQVELRVLTARGRIVRTHRESLLVVPAVPESAFPDSDAIVVPVPGTDPLQVRINARPSMVRPVARQLLPDAVRAILVQRVDQLGDLICSFPALRRLRCFFPAARLIGLVTRGNADLAQASGLFDEIVVAEFDVDRREGARVLLPAQQAALRAKLAFFSFDLAIDLGEGAESRPLLLLSGAPFLAGFKDRDFPWLSVGFDFNGHDPVNRLEIMPASRKILALIEALGAMLVPTAEIMPLPDAARRAAAALGWQEGFRYVVLHAGARLPYARWPHVATLAARLIAETDLALVIFADDPVTALALADGLPLDRVRTIGTLLPFEQFDAVLASCVAFVGNDSGPKHLAALRGVPVVSLHMARVNWSEWGQELSGTIISRRVPCAGCGIGDDAEECAKEFACLHQIQVDEVFGALLALIPEAHHQPASGTAPSETA